MLVLASIRVRINMPSELDAMPITYNGRFMEDHAGSILSDPRVALQELIANAYDAGATEVRILWPDALDGVFHLVDNGTGMTREQFEKRWGQMSYNRLVDQSSSVEFPTDVIEPPRRRAFGQNGKGRHSAFCFNNEYSIATCRGGQKTTANVFLTSGDYHPFRVDVDDPVSEPGHGTSIDVIVRRNHMPLSTLINAVSGKFLVDPAFSIVLNGKPIELESLASGQEHVLNTQDGNVPIIAIDGESADRTTRLRGITYWVNGRMVGESSWDGLDQSGAILDGRSAAAKRFSFVVKADVLGEEVLADWSGFRRTPKVQRVLEEVRKRIIDLLGTATGDSLRNRKIAALTSNREEIRSMSPVSRKAVSNFIDSIQQRCPTLSTDVLSKTAEVFTKMESARSGHTLLRQLAACSPEDLDRWSKIVDEWTARDAQSVLDELGRRLALIRELERLVNDKTTDELQDLQPLFERGLWIFGPEYERVDFKSNRALTTVIRDLVGGTSLPIEGPRRRPDLVALPNSTIGVYSADRWDGEGESDGIDKVLIVELKKGGFNVTKKELRQGEDYAMELRKGNRVHEGTRFTVFVLGSTLGDDARGDRTVDDTIVIKPMIYDHFIKRAHNRTFNLWQTVSDASKALVSDSDVDEVLAPNNLFDPLEERATAA